MIYNFYLFTNIIIGWYYASLGGLLGTYNNEQYDEKQLPNNTIEMNIAKLAHAWTVKNTTAPANPDKYNNTSCEKFFQNKVSPLHPCFSLVSYIKYICLLY